MISKRGQFYIIAAVIISIIIIGFAALTNTVYVKKEPQKFYELDTVLQMEGLRVIEHSEFNQKNVDSSINSYLNAFKNYVEQNTNEDFNVIIFYGNAKSGKISAKLFTRASLGNLNINLGGETNFNVQSGNDVEIRDAIVVVNPAVAGQGRTVNVTIIGENENIIQTLPILEDNNFVFVMTTSSGFNQYIQNSANSNLP